MKIIKSKRLKRFLYMLGFEFQLVTVQNKEQYHFEETELLNECVEFYYNTRSKMQKLENK